MGADLTPNQRIALSAAVGAQVFRECAERDLELRVREALKAGVPKLTLANRLGVSRSRVRILARDEQ